LADLEAIDTVNIYPYRGDEAYCYSKHN